MAVAPLVTVPASNRSMSGSGDFKGFSSVLTVQTWLTNEKARRSKLREHRGRGKSVPGQKRSSPDGSDTVSICIVEIDSRLTVIRAPEAPTPTPVASVLTVRSNSRGRPHPHGQIRHGPMI